MVATDVVFIQISGYIGSMIIGSMHAAFVAEVRAFLEETGMSKSALGRESRNDARFIADVLEHGRSPRLDVADSVLSYMKRKRAEKSSGENDDSGMVR